MRTWRATTLFLVAACLCSAADAQEKGDGTFRVEYQYIRTGVFDSSIGEIDIGNTDSHVLFLSGTYRFTDRWSIAASLPWITKRHTGALPHNPIEDFEEFEPPDLTVIDDGDYHSDWQDIYVALSYLAVDGEFMLEPFVSVGLPTNSYPFYGHAAVGRNLWHVPVGAAFAWQPLFSDYFITGDVAYVFTEKTLGVDVSHWLINARASYFVTDRFIPNVFVNIKHGFEGLDFPDDFDLADLDNEGWYQHDRTIKHNFVNAGIGFDWLFGERYQLSASWFTMVNPDQVNTVERAWTLGITHYFSARRD